MGKHLEMPFFPPSNCGRGDFLLQHSSTRRRVGSRCVKRDEPQAEAFSTRHKPTGLPWTGNWEEAQWACTGRWAVSRVTGGDVSEPGRLWRGRFRCLLAWAVVVLLPLAVPAGAGDQHRATFLPELWGVLQRLSQKETLKVSITAWCWYV